MRPALALVLWLLAPPVAAAPDAYRKVATEDGVSLALYRYVPRGAPSLAPAVLVVPDLGFNHRAYESLAAFLRRAGRETFIAELAGQGASSHRAASGLEPFVSKDLPAIARAVQAVRPGRFDVVVHGYSGALVLASAGGELAGSIRRVVAVNPAALAEVPNARVEALLARGGRFESLAWSAEGARTFELLFAHGGRFAPGERRMLRATVLSDLTPQVASGLLTWMRSGDLPLRGASLLARLRAFRKPTLLLLPLRDNYAHPEFAEPLVALATHAPVRLTVLSRMDFLSEDYGHLSVLQGRGARREIFPRMLDFLEGGGNGLENGACGLKKKGVSSAPNNAVHF